MTAKEAIALIPEWQERLRLRDWTIRAVLIDQTENNPVGKVRQINDYKDAIITLLDPDKIPDTWLGNHDPEVTLVHELLHLQAESLNRFLNKKKHARYSQDYERLVELTAIALVTLKRDLEHARSDEAHEAWAQESYGIYT
jgi:hypothetical protein